MSMPRSGLDVACSSVSTVGGKHGTSAADAVSYHQYGEWAAVLLVDVGAKNISGISFSLCRCNL